MTAALSPIPPATLQPIPGLDRAAFEPTSIAEGIQLAKWIVASGFYPALRTAEQAFMVIARGRRMGLGAMESLEAIDIIQGRPATKPVALLAMIYASPLCESLECLEEGAKRSVWRTKRRGHPPSTVTFALEEAAALGLSGRDQWRKQPATMLTWRCIAKLARRVYPELSLGLGLYTAEEVSTFAPPRRETPAPPAPETPAAAPPVGPSKEEVKALFARVLELSGDPTEAMRLWREWVLGAAEENDPERAVKRLRAAEALVARLEEPSPVIDLDADAEAAIARDDARADARAPVPETPAGVLREALQAQLEREPPQ